MKRLLYKKQFKDRNKIIDTFECDTCDYAYSEISLGPQQNKNVVAICFNLGKPTGEEIANLDNTRRNIRDAIENENWTVGKLITVDLITTRIAKSDIKGMTFNNLVGINNLENILDAIKCADYIILAWGNIYDDIFKDYKVKVQFKHYLDKIYDEIESRTDNVYVFGLNKSALPLHPARISEKRLIKFKLNQLLFI
ncbi:DUF1643 domain-containing protein [Limosilactobacillus reuteri]|uniref:DUF1643 domain-containing protein n=1 Tax=Limosilactobacillus reuteri TaxID=1598 RepID=UPI001E51FE31|nr:DUF1643 domain-containing protein [Limosilactobacillus reuteri]MCC4374643.1 DUF1643 domain-containing protein [Limosilactobacillus reuteri]